MVYRCTFAEVIANLKHGYHFLDHPIHFFPRTMWLDLLRHTISVQAYSTTYSRHFLLLTPCTTAVTGWAMHCWPCWVFTEVYPVRWSSCIINGWRHSPTVSSTPLVATSVTLAVNYNGNCAVSSALAGFTPSECLAITNISLLPDRWALYAWQSTVNSPVPERLCDAVWVI